jgi:hypothetical protein
VFELENEFLPAEKLAGSPWLLGVAGRKLIKCPSLLGCCGFTATLQQMLRVGHQKSSMFMRVVAVLRVWRGRKVGSREKIAYRARFARNPKSESPKAEGIQALARDQGDGNAISTNFK